MKLYMVSDTGNYAMEVQVYRAESMEALMPTLAELDEHIFSKRTVEELSVDGRPEKVCGYGYIE